MLNKILKSCYYVSENSKHVNINLKKLDEFIKNLKKQDLNNWLLYNPNNILDFNIETIVNFLLYFEAINYSFWGEPKWCIETDKGIKDGSDALMFAMLSHIKEKGIDFDKMSYDDFCIMLKGNIEIPLLENRYNTIQSIGKVVNQKMDDNFYKFISKYNSDIELFNIIIENFSDFKDERVYFNETIYFYKLAQLLTSDILHLREKFEKIEVCCSNLLGCADYKIPQTLRALGIIEYDEELSKIIDNQKEISISSEFEVEIRASQLVVIDYIKNKLPNLNSIDINDLIYMYSTKVKNIVKPYHLCRNTNY